MTIAVLIAAFLVIKFIFSALKWIVIGGLAVGVAWLFLKDDTPSSKSG